MTDQTGKKPCSHCPQCKKALSRTYYTTDGLVFCSGDPCQLAYYEAERIAEEAKRAPVSPVKTAGQRRATKVHFLEVQEGTKRLSCRQAPSVAQLAQATSDLALVTCQHCLVNGQCWVERCKARRVRERTL